MTGAEHFVEAEQALSAAKDCETGSAIERYYLAEAQVHATLALAAAQPTADATLLCPHGALLCSVCLQDAIADRVSGR